MSFNVNIKFVGRLIICYWSLTFIYAKADYLIKILLNFEVGKQLFINVIMNNLHRLWKPCVTRYCATDKVMSTLCPASLFTVVSIKIFCHTMRISVVTLILPSIPKDHILLLFLKLVAYINANRKVHGKQHIWEKIKEQ